jgi:hypothetical protein
VIASRLSRSSSFERRVAYLFKHSRAMFAATHNLLSSKLGVAIEMEATWLAQARLKSAAGIRRGGRRCESPVCHDVISWDKDERPNLADMESASRSYLAAIGLSEHQALMVGHDHNGKRHVHIIANAVHPVTGRVADRTNDHHKAQAWALAYEVAQGQVRCRNRTAPRIDRAFTLAATGKKKSAQRLSRAAFEKKRRRKADDAEAKKRHKVEAWMRLIAQQAGTAVNIARPPDKQKADNLSAPRP